MAKGDGKKRVAAAIATAAPAGLPPAGPPGHLANRFEMRKDGLFRKSLDDKPDLWVCSPFAIVAETRDDTGQGWGLLLTWRDRDGTEHSEAFPRSLFVGECADLRARLADAGLSMNGIQAARQAFAEYLNVAQSPVRARSVARIGWHQLAAGLVYVLPDEVFGQALERVVLQTATREPSFFGQAGTLEDWRGTIGTLCCGNSRLTFYAACAFAAPLLHLVNQDGGGFNLLGKSQTGKSTALRVLASVAGGSPKDGAEGYWRSWRATGNGMEGVAALHNDAVLCLDEMGMMDPREAGDVAYMLANGSGKSRASRLGTARDVARWRLLFCSTGEIGLADKNAEAGKRTQAGQEVRLVDIPADAGANMGVFEELHDCDTPGDLARRLAELTTRFYGTPLRAFLRLVVERQRRDGAAFAAELRQQADALARAWLADHPKASGQVRSVAVRFAIVGVAGDLATLALITGWAGQGASEAAHICFLAFLANRGTVASREDTQAVAQLRAFISINGAGRFDVWEDEYSLAAAQRDDGSMPTPRERGFRVQKRAGWRRWEELEKGTSLWRYYLTVDGMKEALAGLAQRDAKRTLAERGFLIPSSDKGDAEKGILARSMRVPGHDRHRLYQIGDGLMVVDDEAG